MPLARAAAWEPGISHAQRVTRLYRTSLRNSRDWLIDYDMWVADAKVIQGRFRANANKSVAEGRDLCEAGMAELFRRRHPDPYIPIYAEGSSKYQRNVPPPPEVSFARRSASTSALVLCMASTFSWRLEKSSRRVSDLIAILFAASLVSRASLSLRLVLRGASAAGRVVYAASSRVHSVKRVDPEILLCIASESFRPCRPWRRGS